MTIDEFIEKCQKRPIPNNPMEKVKILAKELAEGASHELFPYTPNATTGSGLIYQNLKQYYKIRWNDVNFPHSTLMRTLKYVDSTDRLTVEAFKLLDEIDASLVFISYKRTESSAFALLVNNTLKQHGIEPFVDMQLQAGEDWRVELEKNIKNSDYFIILLGNNTLNSEVTVKEIEWAIKGDVTVIPIWHNGFEFKTEEWLNLPSEVSQALSSTHTIRVLEENPLTYDTALRELLNRFGVSI